MKPFVKVSHRFGKVSLTIVPNNIRATTIRLTGEEAQTVADELAECAYRLRHKRPSRMKKLRLIIQG